MEQVKVGSQVSLPVDQLLIQCQGTTLTCKAEMSTELQVPLDVSPAQLRRDYDWSPPSASAGIIYIHLVPLRKPKLFITLQRWPL